MKNPAGYCPDHSTGVSCPTWLGLEGSTGVTDDGLAHAFAELSRQVPEPWELTGVTYHGPDRRWVAFVYNGATNEFGPEGVGETAFEALADLRPRLGELK